MSFKTKREKTAFIAGMAAQRRKRSETPKTKSRTKEKPKYLGPVCVNGEFYDTNFKKPVKIDKDTVRRLHSEYDFDGKRTDEQVVKQYVNHMRHKYGSFDKNGKFLGILGD